MLFFYTICYKSNSMRIAGRFLISILGGILCSVAVTGKPGQLVPIAHEDPAIRYWSDELHDPVAELNHKIRSGSAGLTFDKTFGYLPSLLHNLGISAASQLMVFSKTSLQSMLISPSNPRAIYFNDAVAVAWVRGSPLLELVAQDPQQGMIFYSLDQSLQTRPLPGRDETACLGCHSTPSSLGVPGTILRTVFPQETGAIVTGLIGSESDHRTPFAERWGGWYVTGKAGPPFHRGNATVSNVRETSTIPAPDPVRRVPLPDRFSTSGYLTPYSDIVALSVFEHQMHMMNQITRIGWDFRVVAHRHPDRHDGAATRLLQEAVRDFVDYLLFVDEATWTAPIEGTSGFAEEFARLGPFDGKGRSLRQFDLQNRLMRYPCSYMIYSDVFKALPVEAREAIYRRMWAVLSGSAEERKYRGLSSSARQAVVEILRGTLKDLPDYFGPAVR
jgi:hypothetical protein